MSGTIRIKKDVEQTHIMLPTNLKRKAEKVAELSGSSLTQLIIRGLTNEVKASEEYRAIFEVPVVTATTQE